MSLPSAVHVSPLSCAKLLGTGRHVILLFSRSVPSPSMCICVYLYYIRCSGCCSYFVLCRRKKRRSRDESRHREKGRTDEISVLSFLSSYLRWEVSKEGQLSYPNFVRGILLDDMQSLVSRFEILGVLCCTNKWSPETSQKSKGSRLTRSVKFRNVAEVEKRCFCAIRKFL